MPKKRFVFMTAVSAIAAVILMCTVIVCVRQTSRKMTQYSFDDLTKATRTLADDMYHTMKMDQTLLKTMAALIAGQEEEDEESLVEIMNAVDFGESFINRVELLMPDECLILNDGTKLNASGRLNFEEEAAKGAYISDRMQGISDPGDFVICNAVPVVKRGETVAMLYGVISLTAQSKKYAVNFYEGNAFIQVIDGTNGDVLLDTWHPTLGNLQDMNDRKILIGESYDTIRKKQMEGKNGDMSFVSKTIGETMYLHYEPMGINNWSVTLGVSESAALKEVRDCTRPLYVMAWIVGAVLTIYAAIATAYQAISKRSIYRMSITDENTQLLNRSAYETYLQKNKEKVFSEAVCIYVDVNGLHEINNRLGHAAGDAMLKKVAESLKKQFGKDSVYRIGGDEFVIFPEKHGRMACEEKMRTVSEELKACSYSIAYGISVMENEKGLGRVVKEADEKMLENKKRHYAESGTRARR